MWEDRLGVREAPLYKATLVNHSSRESQPLWSNIISLRKEAGASLSFQKTPVHVYFCASWYGGNSLLFFFAFLLISGVHSSHGFHGPTPRISTKTKTTCLLLRVLVCKQQKGRKYIRLPCLSPSADIRRKFTFALFRFLLLFALF